MNREVDSALAHHIESFRQMAFLAGPRQVGKTTTIRQTLANYENTSYLNWDDFTDRRTILGGMGPLKQSLGLNKLNNKNLICGFDELHKYSEWRDFLKGFFDGNPNLKVLVTGSARLTVYSHGGDSLRGRYFAYTMHPLSVAELAHEGEMVSSEREFIPPIQLQDDQWHTLLLFGGFPEPFLRSSQNFHRRWSISTSDQLLREDIRDLTRIQALSQIEMLATRIQHQVSQLMSYSSFARDIRSTIPTVTRWIETLESLYYCFRVTPWFTNVARALRKEPKYYLWDWSQVPNQGARHENLVASALMKYTQRRTELGYGTYSLHFLRDKQKREVDFVVVRDGKPLMIVEVKTNTKAGISKHLSYFQEQLGVKYAFQVAIDADYVDRDCFEETAPIIVPAKTFLAQLI